MAVPPRRRSRTGLLVSLAIGLPVLLAVLLGGWCLLSDACGSGSRPAPTPPVATDPGPVVEPAPTGAASAAHDQLRGYVPPALEPGCADSIPMGLSVASLDCTAPGEAAPDRVTYDLYASAEDLMAAYAEFTVQAGVLPGTVGHCPSEGPWTAGELEPGRMVCAGTVDGGVVVGWTDERLLVGAVAFDMTGDSEALLDWWAANEGGPLLP